MLTSNGYGTNISKNSFIGRNTIIANHEMIVRHKAKQFHLVQNANDDDSCIFSNTYFKKSRPATHPFFSKTLRKGGN